MPCRLLLVLIGAIAVLAGSPEPVPSPSAFRTEPLTLWPVTRTPTPFNLVAQPSERPTSREIPPLQSPRTGVTCSMRILGVRPVPDPGMIVAAPSHPDRIVRRSLSPCVD